MYSHTNTKIQLFDKSFLYNKNLRSLLTFKNVSYYILAHKNVRANLFEKHNQL